MPALANLSLRPEQSQVRPAFGKNQPYRSILRARVTYLDCCLKHHYTTFILLNYLLTGDGVITSAQMRAARALLGIDQVKLAELSGVSIATIQRMEASDGNVRGVVDSLTKVVGALNSVGVDFVGDHERSDRGGRGVRLRHPDVLLGKAH